MIRWNQLKMDVSYKQEQIISKLSRTLHIDTKSISNLMILRESIDARKKDRIVANLCIAFECDNEDLILKKFQNKYQLLKYEDKKYELPQIKSKPKTNVPIIIGAGPAGIFCWYYLAKAGLKPILFERGKSVEERSVDVDDFWKTGTLNPESNVQFGEGGAGTFSDGKLNTLTKDPFLFQKEVLSLFVKMGADEEIKYKQLPHIGTDRLIDIVRNIRLDGIKYGGKVHFSSKLTDLYVTNGHIKEICINENDWYPCSTLILALGHSARDTFEMLHHKNLSMEPKSFAVGYRVMHSQKYVNERQYGKKAAEVLPNAPYKLTTSARNNRGVYSFCMCPGGYVVNASSEQQRTCINGMSYHDRNSGIANSAIIVSITPDDYLSEQKSPLDGMYFQRHIEEKTYQLANGKVPLQYYSDFKNNCMKMSETKNEFAVKGQYEFCNLRGIYPKYIEDAFLDGMKNFNDKMQGFTTENPVLSICESRTSSPIRISRNTDDLNSINMKGVFPCGEGAGYAGGITSAAMDGLKVADKILHSLINEEVED